MNINIKKISSNQVELEIEIPAPQVENYFKIAASELSKNMKISGFRPGKVPIEIVEQEKGSQTLYDQAANLVIQKTLPKIILDKKLEVVGQPEIVVTHIARGNPMKYKATFSTIPEIELSEYKGLEIKKKTLKVENEEIDKSLKYLQKSRAKFITVNRPAELGDRVEIDFTTRSSGVKIEGGESKNHPLIIGEARFIPGFEEKLVGMKEGEEKSFNSIVPENWPQKNLASKNLDFQVKINLVQKRDIPKLSDEWAKNLGDFQSLKNLKEKIKEDIIKEKEMKEKERIRMGLMKKIAEDSKINIPQKLIDIELKKMIDELQSNLKNMGLELDKYLDEVKKTIDDLKKEWQNQAEKRVKIALILKKIAEKEKIEISQEEIEKRINQDLKRYPEMKEAEKRIDHNLLKEYTMNILSNERVFKLIEKEAKIEKNIGRQEKEEEN